LKRLDLCWFILARGATPSAVQTRHAALYCIDETPRKTMRREDVGAAGSVADRVGGVGAWGDGTAGAPAGAADMT